MPQPGSDPKQRKARGPIDASTLAQLQKDDQIRPRRKLKLAIDAEYAPGEANSALRKQFGLQGARAMS